MKLKARGERGWSHTVAKAVAKAVAKRPVQRLSPRLSQKAVAKAVTKIITKAVANAVTKIVTKHLTNAAVTAVAKGCRKRLSQKAVGITATKAVTKAVAKAVTKALTMPGRLASPRGILLLASVLTVALGGWLPDATPANLDWWLGLADPRGDPVKNGNGSATGEESFEESVRRARCLEFCTQKYGRDVHYTESDMFYNFYRPPRHCGVSGHCSDCQQSCWVTMLNKRTCVSNCANASCVVGCDFLFYTASGELSKSQDIVTVSPIQECCQEQFGHYNVTVYLRWDVNETMESGSQSNPVSLIFIVEARARYPNGRTTPWKPFLTLRGWNGVAMNRQVDYMLRVTPVRYDGIAGDARETPWMTAVPEAVRQTLDPPTIGDVEVAIDDFSHNVHAVISWSPGPGMFCGYHLSVLPQSHRAGPPIVVITTKMPELKYRVDKLKYDTKYTIVLSSCGDNSPTCGRNTSSKTFMVPPCLALGGYNLQRCAPDLPANVSIEVTSRPLGDNERSSWNASCVVVVIVRWVEPPFVMGLNVVHYRLTWEEFIIVPGLMYYDGVELAQNETQYEIRGLKPNAIYDVTLSVIGPAGESERHAENVDTSGGACSEPLVLAASSVAFDEAVLPGLLVALTLFTAGVVAAAFVIRKQLLRRRGRHQISAWARTIT